MTLVGQVFVSTDESAYFFFAITALCRLIILQGKGISTVDLVYESGAVLLLAMSAVAIQWRTNLSTRITKPDDDDDSRATQGPRASAGS